MLKKHALFDQKSFKRCRQIARLKQRVLSFTFYITHKDFTRKSYAFIYLIGSVVKIVLYLHFVYTKDDRLRQIKKKHD